MTDIPTAHRRLTAILDEVDTVIVGKRSSHRGRALGDPRGGPRAHRGLPRAG